MGGERHFKHKAVPLPPKLMSQPHTMWPTSEETPPTLPRKNHHQSPPTTSDVSDDHSCRVSLFPFCLTATSVAVAVEPKTNERNATKELFATDLQLVCIVQGYKLKGIPQKGKRTIFGCSRGPVASLGERHPAPFKIRFSR